MRISSTDLWMMMIPILPMTLTLSSAKQLTLDDVSDSDDARAFANLFVAEDFMGDGDGTLNKSDPGNDVVKEGASSSLRKDETSFIALEVVEFLNSDANKLKDDDVMKSVVDDVPLSEIAKESNIIDGSGVKEVDWGSFYAVSSEYDNRGLCLYSDFFTELEGTTRNVKGKAEVDFAIVGNLVSNDKKNRSVGFENSADSASGQYLDNSQSWENLYPEWKYDASSGQWYQVDSHDTSVDSQESYTNSTSNGKNCC